MASLIMIAIIIIWIYVGNKLPIIVQRGIVLVVDLAAVILFIIASLDGFERIITIFSIVMLALFWIAKDNRFQKDKRINWKETKIVDLLFTIGVVVITLVLDVFN